MLNTQGKRESEQAFILPPNRTARQDFESPVMSNSCVKAGHLMELGPRSRVQTEKVTDGAQRTTQTGVGSSLS